MKVFEKWDEKEAIYLTTSFQTSPDGNVTLSTLVFVPRVEDAGKFVGCRAADQLTGEGSLEDGWNLSITCKTSPRHDPRQQLLNLFTETQN